MLYQKKRTFILQTLKLKDGTEICVYLWKEKISGICIPEKYVMLQF